jgi:prophage DNA circulation protein
MALSFGDLTDNLQPASWRGIQFHIPDARSGSGRRVQSLLFPGLDYRVHQDMGALDGPVTVSGVVVGDDYVQRGQQLIEAFRTRGPGTLVHPWYGELTLVCMDAPELALDWRTLRLARFSATFEYWREMPEPAFDALGLLLLAVESTKAALRRLLRDVLAPARLAFGAFNAVAGLALWVKGSLVNLVGGLGGGGALLGSLAPGFGQLAGLGAVAADASYPAVVADAFAAAPDACATAALPAPGPAIGTAADTAAAVAMDPAAIATALLGLASAAPPASLAPPAGVLLAAQGFALAGAIAAAARIQHASQQDALAWKARLDAAILARMQAAAAMAVDAPAAVAGLYQALAALRQALARDISAELGRLPAVKRLTLPADAPLWLVAHHLVGDTPALVRPMLADLVARNGIRQPALVRAGTTLEYLA